MKVIIVYDTKYGATEEIAKKLSELTGAVAVRVQEFPEEQDFDFMVLGSPILSGYITRDLKEFISKHQEKIAKNGAAVFVTCLAPQVVQYNGKEVCGIHYTQEMNELLGESIKLKEAFGGRRIISKLDESDYIKLKVFNEKIGKKFQDVDIIEWDRILKYAEKLKHTINAEVFS